MDVVDVEVVEVGDLDEQRLRVGDGHVHLAAQGPDPHVHGGHPLVAVRLLERLRVAGDDRGQDGQALRAARGEDDVAQAVDREAGGVELALADVPVVGAVQDERVGGAGAVEALVDALGPAVAAGGVAPSRTTMPRPKCAASLASRGVAYPRSSDEPWPRVMLSPNPM